jgi:catechol 2,3-dioxygenase-like lactoylglutathione lyase family enzyme
MRQLTTVFLICAVMTIPAAFGQTPATAPPGAVVIGSGSFSPIVRDLDKSLAFYRNLLGVAAPASAGPTPFSGADQVLLNFLGAPTAQVRVGTVRIPGTTMNVEIVDFKDVDRKPVAPRLQDPGAVMLILLVRDVDSLLERLKKEGVPVVTAGGAPVNVGGPDKARAVVIKDPDGFHIALAQLDPLPPTTAPDSSNVIGARFGLTVSDTDKAMRVYRDVLGFEPASRGFVTDNTLNNVFNTPNAQVRRTTAQVPGSFLLVEFLEFKNIDRKPINARIQDPGATRLQLRVRDSDKAVRDLKAAGGQVVTVGGNGEPIDMRGLHLAIVRELDNLFLVIFSQAAQAPAGQRN